MFWLIWIAIMLLIPIVAGVNVWREIHKRADESPADEPFGAQQQREPR
jgi:hypothetical protein